MGVYFHTLLKSSRLKTFVECKENNRKCKACSFARRERMLFAGGSFLVRRVLSLPEKAGPSLVLKWARRLIVCLFMLFGQILKYLKHNEIVEK